MSLLNGEKLKAKAAAGIKYHIVPIEAWGGEKVCLRELDGIQLHEWDTRNAQRAKDERVVMDLGTSVEHLICLSLVDVSWQDGYDQSAETFLNDDGTLRPGVKANPVFPRGNKEDCRTVRAWGAAATEIHTACLVINRLTGSQMQAMQKNFLTTLAPASGSILQTGQEKASENS